MLGAKPFDVVTFLLAISLGAGWQLTYGPYVADYSRYLPADTPTARSFRSTFLGSVLGSQLSMTSAFRRDARVTTAARTAYIVGFLVVSVLLALLASADFLSNFKNFVLVLLMVFTPWSAVNLVDYYLISREKVDIPALYDPDGRYGRWNAPALTAYVVAIVAQVPFLAQSLYTGPVTGWLGGADISWIVGLVVAGAVYYPWARRTSRAPDAMVYPAGSGLGDEASAEVSR